MKNVFGKLLRTLLGKSTTSVINAGKQDIAQQLENVTDYQHTEDQHGDQVSPSEHIVCKQTRSATVVDSKYMLSQGSKSTDFWVYNNKEQFKPKEGLMEKIKDIDADRPPGIAGDMCKDIARMERRRLPTLRPAAALAVLSALSRNRLNSDGEKMTFFAMITALSGSGKEAHQRYIKTVLTELKSHGMLCGKPRSDRNIMLDLFEHQEVAYVLDEGHELFGKALSPNSKSFESSMEDLLLELKTCSTFTLPGNLARELSAPVNQKLESLKDKNTLSDRDTRRTLELETELEHIKNGMPHPYLSLVSYSTPTKADFIVSLETILSGFIGRFFYWRGPSVRGPLLKNIESKVPCADIIKRCELINGVEYQIEMSHDCDELLDEIVDYFEQDEMLNHEQLGAIYARGSEQVKQMASLLAAETGKISPEMLLYSTRLFIDNVNCYMEVLDKKLAHDKKQLDDSVEKIVLHVSTKYGPVKKGFLANQIDKRNATVRKIRKEKDSKFHYQLINQLIEREVLIDVDGDLIHNKVLGCQYAA